MKCPSCGRENRPGVRFCEECGHVLIPEEITMHPESGNPCPSCGFDNRSGIAFCEECGTSLPAKVTSEKSPKKKICDNKKCPACGASNRLEVSFCEECGETFTPKKSRTKQTAAAPIIQKKKKWLLPVGLAAATLISAVLIWQFALHPGIDLETDTGSKNDTAAPEAKPASMKSEAESAVGSSTCTPAFNELPVSVYIPGDEHETGIELVGSADFNKDGAPDLIITRILFQTSVNAPIDILINDGTGKFSRETKNLFPGDTPTAQHPTKILLEDFNGDGYTDAYISDEGKDAPPFPGNANTLLLSNGDGTYRDAVENVPPQPDETHRSTAADVDQDGDVDIYVGNLGGGGMSPYLLLNDGSGKFSKAENTLSTDVTNLSRNWYTTCGLVDVNNDHYPDLILGQGDAYKPSHIYLNNGSGQFDIPSFELPISIIGDTQHALDIDPIDLNGDKWIDLAVIYTDKNYARRAIQLLINQGGTSFKDETEARISQTTHGNWIHFMEVRDFNNDGAPDFAIGILGEKSALYMNDGNGVFTKSRLNFDLFTFAAGDFDDDGWLDLVNSGSAYRGSPEFHATFISQGCP